MQDKVWKQMEKLLSVDRALERRAMMTKTDLMRLVDAYLTPTGVPQGQICAQREIWWWWWGGGEGGEWRVVVATATWFSALEGQFLYSVWFVTMSLTLFSIPICIASPDGIHSCLTLLLFRCTVTQFLGKVLHWITVSDSLTAQCDQFAGLESNRGCYGMGTRGYMPWNPSLLSYLQGE